MAHLSQAADGCLSFVMFFRRQQDGNVAAEFPPRTAGVRLRCYDIFM